MIPSSWRRWLNGFTPRTPFRRQHQPRRRPSRGPYVEPLEDRTVPATVISILDGGVGSLDGFLSATDGTITAADNAGISGTVSRGALQGVNANVNISITAETQIFVNDLTSTLALQTGAGNSASFTANTPSITFADTTDGISTAGGAITFSATTSLSLGGLSSSSGDINLQAGTSLAINQAVNAGTGDIRIVAGTTVNQAAAGLITAADELGIRAGGTVTLTAATNDVNTLAVSTTGIIEFRDSDDLSIGTVLAGGSAGFTTDTSGLVSNSNDINLNVGTSLSLTRVIDAGTADVRLVVGTTASQTEPLAVITADELGITAGGAVTLALTSNDVNTLAVSTTGTIEFRDNDDLIIGAVAAGGSAGFTGATGLVSNGGDINLNAGTTLAFNQAINAGAGDIRLVVSGVSITQAAAGVITADELGIIAGGGVTLCVATNDVNTLAVSADGLIEFRDGDDLTVGTVAAGGGAGFTGATGVVTTNDDINLNVGSLVINQPINAGTADVRIVAGTTVTQSATGVITADELGMTAGGAVTLSAATNDVNTLAISTPGLIEFRDVDELVVGQVLTGGGCGFTTTNGVSAGSLNLLAGGAIADAADADINVSGNATFNAGTNAITIGDAADNLDNFGSLTFAGGTVFISEDSATLLTGTVVLGPTTTLTSTGSVDALAAIIEFTVKDPYTTAGTDYDQLIVNGATLDLSAATLSFVSAGGGTAPALPNLVKLIQNNTGNPTIPSASPAESAIVTLGAGANARDFRIFYNDGDGNDVVLVDAHVNLVVTKTDSPDPVRVANNITYTITLRNDGPGHALGISLTDSIPVNTTFVSFTAPAGFATTTPAVGGTGTVTATTPVLAAGAVATFTLVVRVAAQAPSNPPIVNTVTVTSAPSETTPGDNTATATTPIAHVAYIAVGAAPGAKPRVAVFSPNGAIVASFLAFNPNARGGVRVAVGDVNGDGVSDIIVAQGPGARSLVKIIDGTKLAGLSPSSVVPNSSLLAAFLAYQPGFTGGVFVAAGDVDGDGRDDIITGPGSGAERRVKVIDAARVHMLIPDGRISFAALHGFFLPYQPQFSGGVTVAAGDVNGDDKADVLTGPASGARVVKVVDGTKLKLTETDNRISNTALLGSFFAFQPSFTGGVFVGAGKVNADGQADIVVGPGAGSAPLVKVVDGAKLGQTTPGGQISGGSLLAHERVFGQFFRGGVRVGTIDVDADGLAEILVASGPAGAGVGAVRVRDVLQKVTDLDLVLRFGGLFAAGG